MDRIGPLVDVTPATTPPAAAIEGRFVRLDPVGREHAAALYEGSHRGPEDRSIWTYMPYGPFGGADEMAGWIASIEASTDPLFFAVVDVASEEPVGMASLLNIDTSMRRLELGHIWYARDAQRGRANTETAYLLLRHAFDVWGYRRAEWKCDALNERSRAAALRLGFTFEGIFRQHMIVKGHNRDTAWFAMLDGEWPSRRAAMEAWLDAEPGSVSLGELMTPRRQDG
jgi:RimJ/RimL family protein N-acetyltransferase